MNSHLRRRVATVLGLALTALAFPLIAHVGVAQACACGVFSPGHGGNATVSKETALVRTAATGTEDIYLSLTLDSDVRSGALLFPVPDKHATVSAGPHTLFTQLAAITAPPVAGEEPTGNRAGAAAPAPRVTVESRQAIGPLDVVTLSSNDAGALSTWLTQNGFTAKPTLAAAATPYIAQGWAFMAVRLRPEAASTTRLDGQLDPLHLHFATDRTVYPMRLSHNAAEPEQVTIYTLAAHEQTLITADPGMSLVWAGRLTPADHPDLASVTGGGTTFLTRYDGTLTPATISDDFHFANAAADTATPDSTAGTKPAASSNSDADRPAKVTLAIVAGLLVLGLFGAAIMIEQRRRSSRRG